MLLLTNEARKLKLVPPPVHDETILLLKLPVWFKRDDLKKCCFSLDFFHKGGGGEFRSNPKAWGTFCAPSILKFWVEKVGSVDQSQKLCCIKK